MEASTTFSRIKDLIDQYQPDLMYSRWPDLLRRVGQRSLMAHHYKVSCAKRSGGKVDAVWANKGKERLRQRQPASSISSAASSNDLGRSLADRHLHRHLALQQGSHLQDPEDRHRHAGRYRESQRQSAPEFPLPSSGMPDDEELKIVDAITAWMKGQLRGNLRHSPVESVWRRPRDCQNAARRRLKRHPGALQQEPAP